MSVTETFTGNSYEVVAWARGQRALLFEQYGSYEGEWLLFAKDDATGDYLIYKDYYGSCSGCDSYQAEDNGEWTRDKALEFAKAYPPFIEIPRDTAKALAENGTLLTVFPANVSTGYGDEMDMPGFSLDATAHIKLEEGLSFSVAEVWAIPNMELRRRAWEAYGVVRFIADAGALFLETEGADSLIVVPSRENEKYLFLKDSSTPRVYLLRVPPEMERVREAKAWTFNLTEQEYAPSIET